MSRLRLGVNIDHVATVRNARGENYPDPVRAAEMALAAGADGITAHLREDRRHITDTDIEALIEHGMVKASDMELFAFADDAEGVWAALLAGGLKPGESIEKPALSHTKLAAKRDI